MKQFFWYFTLEKKSFTLKYLFGGGVPGNLSMIFKKDFLENRRTCKSSWRNPEKRTKEKIFSKTGSLGDLHLVSDTKTMKKPSVPNRALVFFTYYSHISLPYLKQKERLCASTLM